MPKRMLKYASLIYESYNEFPNQMVLYVGDRNIKIPSKIKEKNLRYNYEVRDIREFDCSILIESDDIADNIIAVLCNIKNIDRFFSRLREKLLRLDNPKREDYLRKLFYLLRLRPEISELYRQKEKEELAMPFIIEKERDPLYKDGLEAGIEKGEKNKAIAIAKSLLDLLDDETIAKRVGLALEEVKRLRERAEKGKK